MVTMVDEIYDRGYRSGRNELNGAIAFVVGRLGSSVRNAFEVLNRIEYSSPWAASTTRPRSH